MIKIRYLSREQLNPVAWDECVAASTQRLVYAFSWYLDALTTGPGAPHWGGFVAEGGGGYRAVMPVVFCRRFGFSCVYMPDYCQQLGIFCREDWPVSTGFPVFLEHLTARFRWVAAYRFNETNEQELDFPPGWPVTKRINHILPLTKPYPDLYRGYATDRKTNLKRAENVGWRLEDITDIRPLLGLHRQHNEQKATGGLRLDLRIYDRFAAAVDQLVVRGKARIRMAHSADEKAPQAGGLFVHDGSRITYLFNGASEVGRKRQARLWMIDRLIRASAGRPIVFDFESPAVGAESVWAYYGSFGAEARSYSEIAYDRLPGPVRWARKAKRAMTRPFRSYRL
ncbi:GNAT family N-acetyltransferase [Larkinella soli]|uniref:GNAT family N-acetyltransferase n=1 Tax=Larkinella soli TaxID=1770527 RepID=UPI000FFB7C3F|nr:GNAT family N-acetyltransferase [Larkinella soli]